MKKIITIYAILALLLALPVKAEEFSVVMSDMGFETTDLLNEMGDIPLNDDICISIEKGNSDAKYYSSGYVQVPINSKIYIKGATEDVSITEICFTITTNSYRFYLENTVCEPAGTFTWDADNKINKWVDEEGANSVMFPCYGTIRFKEISVKYTKPGSGDPAGSKTFTFVMEDYAFSTSESLNDKSPIACNEDIQMSFVGGNTAAKYASAGYINVAPNTTFTVSGISDDVKIEKVVFDVYKKSYKLSDTSFSPTCTLTFDEDALQNTVVPDEPANAIEMKTGFDNLRFMKMTVTYTGGKAQGGDTEDPEPDQPEPEPQDDNLLSTGFDTTAEWNQFTIINVQEGSNTWKHSTGNPYGKVENDLGNTIPKDDYLVSPGLELKAGMTYRLTFDTWCGSPSYPEIIAAYLLKAPTDITDKTAIVAPTEITNDTNNKRELTGFFSVEADGTYYVAIHAASAPGMHYLYADNIEVSRGVNALSPAQVSDFTAAPSPIGENTVTLTFKAPEFCYDGTTALSAISNIIIKRDGTQIATLEATPGQQCTYTDNLDNGGNHRYAVTVSAPSGKSLDAKASVYVGIYKPADPTNLKVEEITPGTVRLSWDPVTTNIYGHTIDPSIVTYRVLEGLYTVYRDGVKDNSIEIEYVPENDGQKIVTFALKAVTSAGESNNPAVAETLAVGTPYSMPFTESFANGEMEQGHVAEFVEDPKIPGLWWRCFESTGDINPSTNDNGFLAFLSHYENTSSTFRTAKIHIDEEAPNPYLTFMYYVDPQSSNTITLFINHDEIETINLGEGEKGWTEKVVNIGSYKGSDIRVAFEALCLTPGIAIVIDKIAVKNEANSDLAISRARIPYEMLIGEDHTCQIIVSNNGINTADSYTVTVKADGEEVVRFNGSALLRGETKEFNFSLSPDLIPGETVVYSVELEATDDENPADNSSEIEVAVRDITLPAPSGIELDGQTLHWGAISEADFPTRNIEESFEAYDEFGIDSAGEWQFVDNDGYPTRGVENPFLHYPNMYEPMAFMVFNNHDGRFPAAGSASYDAYEGGQSMVSIAADWTNRDKINNDDWMISPELSGNAQTISLFARSRSLVFPESFQILYTSGDDALNTAAYSLVEQFDEISNEWTEFKANIPADARYFAIRNISLDRYFLFIDNVSFEAAPKAVPVVGYNVYRSGSNDDNAEWVKANDAALTEPNYTIEDFDTTDFIKVSAIYENGMEIESEPQSLISLGMTAISSETSETVYYTVNGIRLSGEPTESGLYIVRDAKGARKVLISK